MTDFRILPPCQQVVEHLRGELLRRRWSGEMPGAPALAEELNVDPKTVARALILLEKEGLLESQGPGRRRKVVTPKNPVQAKIRIGLLDFDEHPRDPRLTQDLEQAPYSIVTSPKTLRSLKMDLGRIKRHVKSIDADAWVVYAATREVLEWFAKQPFPTFAMFGFMTQLPIAGAGPDSASGYADSVRELAALGHQRIVMLTPSHTRLPEPNRAVRVFLDSLEAEGIQTGSYNLPDWNEEDDEGLHTMLDSLFKFTPPTVLIINDKVTFFAALQFLLERGIRVPGDVSLMCHEFIESAVWCDNSIAYIHWDWALISRRLRNWMKNVSLHKEDTRQHLVKSSFGPGRTLGPPSS